jgi:DNA-binding MarR family transcriptional regulator/N-acetylglutamate synthase-like GNAT family acetyltransferase
MNNGNLINSLGALALGSRLKRLGEQIMTNGKLIYAANNIDFDPKWFPVFYALNTESPLGITEIASRIGFAHPSVIAIVKELEKKGLISSAKHRSDERKRMIALTAKGRALAVRMDDIWKDIREGIEQTIKSHKNNLLFALEETENSFNDISFFDRVQSVTKKRAIEKVRIVNYKPSLKKYFRDLNYEWIKKYFKVEKADREYLENPTERIINKGGIILFAEYEGEIIGTVALINTGSKTFELSKMAVSPKAQGKQAGKKLMQAAIAAAKKAGAKKIFLLSNTLLTPAITLYKRSGFVPINLTEKDSLYYERSNIKMEMNL